MLTLTYWKTSSRKHFVRIGVSTAEQQLLSLDTAEGYDTVMMVASQKHVGTTID